MSDYPFLVIILIILGIIALALNIMSSIGHPIRF